MSGFEVVGTVASVVQLIDVGVRIVERLNDYRHKTNSLPKAFHTVRIRLPAFVDVLRETRIAMDQNRLSDSARNALGPPLAECKIQIHILDVIVEKVLPLDVDSKADRAWKAIRSLKYETDVVEAETALKNYIEAMTHQGVAASRNKDAVPTSPPTPCFVNKPFHQDADFVHRAALDQIISQTHKPKGIPRLALVGLGGVGKTQVAVEYAYRTRRDVEGAWVFWVRAATVARMEEDFRGIAKALRLPGWDEKQTHIFKIVYDFLCSESNGRWVMILDNADDMSVFTAPPPCGPGRFEEQALSIDSTAQIRDFLPKSSTGNILITSRTKDVAFELTGNANYYIELTEMTSEEATELLTVKLRGDHTFDDKLELVSLLDCMPLAISQAAAYISRTPTVDVKSYIEELKKSPDNMSRLLASSITESHRERQRSHSIIATWHLTFQYVRRVNPTAARLLSLICLFDRQGIEKSLLLGNYENPVEDKENEPRVRGMRGSRLWNFFKASRRHQLSHHRLRARYTLSTFLNDCTTLTDFSLVKVAANGHSLIMHRLVQFATEKWLETNNELHSWTKRFTILLRDAYPGHDEYVLSEIQLEFWPHLLRAISYLPPDTEALYPWLKLVLEVASLTERGGFYGKAEDLNRLAIRHLERLVGFDNELTLQGVYQLGVALSLQGKLEEAENMLRRAWIGRQKVLGGAHLHAIMSGNNFRTLLKRQGRMEEALAVSMVNNDATRRRMFGPDYQRTGTAMAPEYYELFSQGETWKAEAVLRRKLDETARPYGEDAVKDIENLSVQCVLHEKYDEAVQLLRDALALRIHFQPTDQDGINTARNNLANALSVGGSYDEAEQLYRQVMAHHDSAETHRDAEQDAAKAEIREHLGAVLARQSHFEEAETLGAQAVAEQERLSRGCENKPTLKAVHTLAETMRLQGRYAEARPLFKRAHAVAYKDRGWHSFEKLPMTKRMMECVDDVREVVRAVEEDGEEGECWGRLQGDERLFLFIFLS